MIFKPTNPETLALATAIENGINEFENTGNEFMYQVVEKSVHEYIQQIIQHYSMEGQIFIGSIEHFHKLSNVLTWTLCYIGVKNVFQKNKGELNYTLISAIETAKKEFPEEIIQGRLNIVDITNIIFNTEFDNIIAWQGLESIMEYVKNMNIQQNTTEPDNEPKIEN